MTTLFNKTSKSTVFVVLAAPSIAWTLFLYAIIHAGIGPDNYDLTLKYILDNNSNISENYEDIVLISGRRDADVYALSALLWKVSFVTTTIVSSIYSIAEYIFAKDIKIQPISIIRVILLLLICTFAMFFFEEMFVSESRGKLIPPNIFGFLILSIFSSCTSLYIIVLSKPKFKSE